MNFKHPPLCPFLVETVDTLNPPITSVIVIYIHTGHSHGLGSLTYLRSLELNVLLICEFGVILHKLSIVKLEIQNP